MIKVFSMQMGWSVLTSLLVVPAFAQNNSDFFFQSSTHYDFHYFSESEPNNGFGSSQLLPTIVNRKDLFIIEGFVNPLDADFYRVPFCMETQMTPIITFMLDFKNDDTSALMSISAWPEGNLTLQFPFPAGEGNVIPNLSHEQFSSTNVFGIATTENLSPTLLQGDELSPRFTLFVKMENNISDTTQTSCETRRDDDPGPQWPPIGRSQTRFEAAVDWVFQNSENELEILAYYQLFVTQHSDQLHCKNSTFLRFILAKANSPALYEMTLSWMEQGTLNFNSRESRVILREMIASQSLQLNVRERAEKLLTLYQ